MTTKATRRQFLATAGAIGAGVWLGTTPVVGAPGAKVESTTIISSHVPYYSGWPTLERRANGELLVVSSSGREAHVCPFGRVEMMRSRDNGKTWTYPRVVMDGPIDDRDAGILETAKGTLLVTTFTSLAFEPALAREEAAAKTGKPPADSARLKRWIAARDRLSADERQSLLDNWMIRSTDGGLTWSARYRVPLNSPHGPVQLADGRQLYAGKALYTEKNEIGVAESSDDGQTWKWLATIPTRKGDDPLKYHELHAVETNDGKLVAHIRNHNPKSAGETLQSESSDGGKTWTEPHAIGVWGLPSHLLKLRDGRLLMSYGYRRKPYGNQVRTSDDGAKTWSEPLTLSGDGAGHDLGYPSTVELDDGSLVSVWYELLAGRKNASLRQARWNLT